MSFAQAIDDALAQAMVDDHRVILEDRVLPNTERILVSVRRLME